jgi:hypothetical protein
VFIVDLPSNLILFEAQPQAGSPTISKMPKPEKPRLYAHPLHHQCLMQLTQVMRAMVLQKARLSTHLSVGYLPQCDSIGATHAAIAASLVHACPGLHRPNTLGPATAKKRNLYCPFGQDGLQAFICIAPLFPTGQRGNESLTLHGNAVKSARCRLHKRQDCAAWWSARDNNYCLFDASK